MWQNLCQFALQQNTFFEPKIVNKVWVFVHFGSFWTCFAARQIDIDLVRFALQQNTFFGRQNHHFSGHKNHHFWDVQIMKNHNFRKVAITTNKYFLERKSGEQYYHFWKANLESNIINFGEQLLEPRPWGLKRPRYTHRTFVPWIRKGK